jgi:RNA polymerase sigma factor (sigma-70 family)
MARARNRPGRPADGAARMEELFRAHCAAVSNYARRRAPEAAVDYVVAETFLTAWRRLDRVPADPLPWLLAVARNVVGTQLRSASRRQGLDLRLRSDPPPADEPARESEVEGPFMAALAGLSEKDREALMLAVWDELAPRQAAAVLGESSATFRARLYRAKRRLRARLEAQGQPEPCRTDRMQAKETTR